MKNSKYHVIMIAAGHSSRIKDLTKDKPKSFLEIKGEKIIDYHLDILNERGFSHVTIVIGYLKELFMKTVGTKYKNLIIDYVISEEYTTTGHSWSFFLTREKWLEKKKPIAFIHADIFYDPKILDLVMNSKYENVTSVDNNFDVNTGDEFVIRGENDLITSIELDSKTRKSSIVGEHMGISKFNPEFTYKFYNFMEKFFKKKGRKLNYEILLSDFIIELREKLHYVKIDNLRWMNINYIEDYEKAKGEIYEEIYGD